MTSTLRAALAASVLMMASGAAVAQTPAPPAAVKPVPAAKPMVPATAPPGPSKAAATPAPGGDAKFPTEVSAKYAKETAGKARMHTCLDQYHANKATNGNGGMKWIQKGGGYYSACSKALKG